MTNDERIERVREIEARRAEAAARECEAIAEIGAVVAGAREAMGRAEFRAWLSEARIAPDAAKRYERVASRRAELERFFPLGPLAVCALSIVPAERLPAIEDDAAVEGVCLREMNCPKLARAIRILLGTPAATRTPMERAQASVRSLARVKATQPATWEAIAPELATIGCRPCEECPPTGHPLEGATREERGKELVVRLADVVERVGEVAVGAGELSRAAREAAITAAKGVLLAVDRLAATGDFATGVVRAG